MATLSTISTKVRRLIDDSAVQGTDVFIYANSAIFTLYETNISSVVEVTVNDDSSGVTYTFDSDTNKVEVTSSLSTGDVVAVIYTYYPNYSDTILQGYVNNALDYMSVYYKTYLVESGDVIYPDTEKGEESLIAVIAAFLINPDNKSIKLPDVTIKPLGEYVRTDVAVKQYIASYKKHGVIGVFGVV